jgi:F-type H+-transporting ATPase subunit delta
MDESTKQSTVFDSDQQQLGNVYAQALLAFGKDSGKLDQMVDELDGVVDVVGQVPGMKGALESPRIGFDDKAKLLDKAFGGKVDKGLVDFLKVVGRKGRFDCLGAILASARVMQDEMSGRVQAVLTSASEIDESVKNNISDKLSKLLGKTVSLTSVVDPEILGGIVVRVGDTVYDGSVVSQLAQVRVKAVKKAADAIRAQLDRFASSS